MLDEDGLSDHGTDAARTQEPGKRSNDMDAKDDEDRASRYPSV